MKFLQYILIFFIFSNCSLNEDSQYWTENSSKSETIKKKLNQILKKTDDITNMTLKEYNIYIDDHTKKSKYPDISK